MWESALWTFSSPLARSLGGIATKKSWDSRRVVTTVDPLIALRYE
jgi:hypothetical protein